MLRFAVQVRTSTDRTGCTNFFRKKMHFLRAWVDKWLDAYKTAHPAATGQGGVMCCTRVPQSGNSGVFCLVPEYTENFAERAKKRQNCNGKRKKPLLVAELQQQGQRGNRILNKTAERIIMRKNSKRRADHMAQEYLPAPSNIRLADLMKEHNISQPELAKRNSAAPRAPSTVLSAAQKGP